MIAGLLICLLLLGVVLLIRGLRGRRVGTEPRCRKCNYDLTGLTSDKCPECGTIASGRNVLTGVRRRRWVSLGVGVLLTLVSSAALGLGLYGRAKNISFYAYYPTAVLVYRANADDAQAISELVRRHRNGDLNARWLVGLAPLALDRQSAKTRSSSTWRWAELLGALEADGLLSPEERKRFYDQSVRVEIVLRPRLRHGDPIRFGLAYEISGAPNITADCRIDAHDVRIGDTCRESLFGPLEFSLASVQTGEITTEIQSRDFEPGTYAVECTVEKRFLWDSDTDWSAPSFTSDVKLRAQLGILPADAEDTVRVVDDPALAADFKRAITISASNRPWSPKPVPGELTIEIAVEGLVPMNGAFRVTGLAGDREVDFGTLALKKGSSHSYKTWRTTSIDAISVAFVAPVLRTSIEVAKETPDMFEIWDGELRFDPIPVKRIGDLSAEQDDPASAPADSQP